MKKHIFVLLALIGSLVFADPALDGLTLALNPNGETLVAAGDTRTIYTLDAETLEVLERNYFGSSINKMLYSADGSILFVQDSVPNIYLLDAKTLETLSKLSDYGMMQILDQSNRKNTCSVDLNYGVIALAIFNPVRPHYKSQNHRI